MLSSCGGSPFFPLLWCHERSVPPVLSLYIIRLLLGGEEWHGYRRRGRERELTSQCLTAILCKACQGKNLEVSPVVRNRQAYTCLGAATLGGSLAALQRPPCHLASSTAAEDCICRVPLERGWHPQSRKCWRAPRPHMWKGTLLLLNPKLTALHN